MVLTAPILTFKPCYAGLFYTCRKAQKCSRENFSTQKCVIQNGVYRHTPLAPFAHHRCGHLYQDDIDGAIYDIAA